MSHIQPTDRLVLFPTYGRLDPTEQFWQINIHGVIFRRELSSRKRELLVRLLRGLLDAHIACL